MKAQTLLNKLNARDAGPRRDDRAYASIVFNARRRAATFACPTCGSHYPTVEKMLACLNQPVERGPFKVGDIVLVGKWWCRREWAASPWVAFTIPARPDSRDHFDRVDNTYLWHVVTSLYEHNHDEVASLIALPSADEISYGWCPTVSDNHLAIYSEARALARDFARGDNDYYKKEFAGMQIEPPSAELRAEAAKLAAAGLVALNLI